MSNKSPFWQQCSLCNRFMSYADLRDAVVWTPFGGCTDLEPPETEYAHRACWEKEPDDHKHLISRIAWQADREIREIGPPIGTEQPT